MEKHYDMQPAVACNDGINSTNARLQVSDTVPPYSEQEAQVLAERLANKKSQKEAVQILITWLERGECNESNSTTFTSLIKLCIDYVEKLKMEQKCVKEAESAEKNLANQCSLIHRDLSEIENVFKAVERQEILDNFTQIERENIQAMNKEVLEFKEDNLMDVVEKNKGDFENDVNKCKKLRQTTNSMTAQLEAARKKIEVGQKILQDNEKEISFLKSELEKRKCLVDTGSQCSSDDDRLRKLLITCLITNILCSNNFSGRSFNDIHSYLTLFYPTINVTETRFVLRSNPGIFSEISLEQGQKWIYVGFAQPDQEELSNIN